jgi:hypothetical protein
LILLPCCLSGRLSASCCDYNLICCADGDGDVMDSLVETEVQIKCCWWDCYRSRMSCPCLIPTIAFSQLTCR